MELQHLLILLTLPIPYLKNLLKLLIPIASAITLFAAANGLMNANAVMMHSMAEERLFNLADVGADDQLVSSVGNYSLTRYCGVHSSQCLAKYCSDRCSL